jgi:hypothetical protein
MTTKSLPLMPGYLKTGPAPRAGSASEHRCVRADAGALRPAPTGRTTTVSSRDLVGSASTPFRGTLTGSVSAAGTLRLAFKGKAISRLGFVATHTVTVLLTAGMWTVTPTLPASRAASILVA